MFLVVLIVILAFAVMTGQFCGWLISHGIFTPFNWRILVPFAGVIMWDHWCDRWYESERAKPYGERAWNKR